MIGGPARCFRHNAFEPKLRQIQRVDERIDSANRVAPIDPLIKAFGQQSRLPTIRPNQKALHPILPQFAREFYRENQSNEAVFAQPGSRCESLKASKCFPLHPYKRTLLQLITSSA